MSTFKEYLETVKALPLGMSVRVFPEETDM
jgi:hypothetical protein